MEIEPFLSSSAVMAMKDYQRWWYISLLFQAWQNVTRPCHLANDAEQLWMWAGAVSKEFFARHSAIVIRQFIEIDSGQWLVNQKQLEVYTNQLGRLDARRDAGSKGGIATASKRAALLQHCSSSPSISISDSDSKFLDSKKEKEFDSDEYVKRVMSIGFRDSTIRTRDLIARALFTEIKNLGADPDEMFESLCQIFKWTSSGVFAKPCYEVIPRWREKQDFWERRPDAKQAGGKFSTGIEELSKYLHGETTSPVAD